jgi:hypothetical protein
MTSAKEEVLVLYEDQEYFIDIDNLEPELIANFLGKKLKIKD